MSKDYVKKLTLKIVLKQIKMEIVWFVLKVIQQEMANVINNMRVVLIIVNTVF